MSAGSGLNYILSIVLIGVTALADDSPLWMSLYVINGKGFTFSTLPLVLFR